MELSRRSVENVTDAIDIAMKQLRDAMVGMPDKEGAFKRSHETAARDAAHFAVLVRESFRIS